MSFFPAHLELLSKRQPELASHLRQAKSCRIEVFPSFQGLPTACYRRESDTIPLHSRYDPLREGRLSLARADLAGADHFILLGFGLGYLLDALLEHDPDPSNRYFIVESDLGIIRAAFEARDLRRILSLPHVHFAWPASGPELAEQWQKFFDPVRAQKSVFVSHAPSLALNPGIFKSAAETIQSQTFQIFTDINTLVGRSQSFLDNFLHNLRSASLSPGVAGFAGKFPKTPAILVSAGPSLDKNIHELRSCDDRALIVATDTALKPLLASGIDPHFVMTADPGWENYLHLQGAAAPESLLVAEATANPASLRDFEGRTIICTFENSVLRSLAELLCHKGTLRVWGSVATMALDFALLLGCDPIIFIGQDLAHSDGRTYCSGLHFEERWFDGILDAEEWTRRWETLRSGLRTMTLEDIIGRPAESTDKLAAYWNWISKELHSHPQLQFINATEGGILRDDVVISSLREALFRHCSASRSLRREVRAAYADACRDAKQGTGCSLETLKSESLAVEQLLAQGKRNCKETPGCSVPELLTRLEAVKESIYSNTRLAPLIDCFNQMGNIAFLRRQAALARRPAGSSTSEIQATYSDYFDSVSLAMNVIKPALHRIEDVLSEFGVPMTAA